MNLLNFTFHNAVQAAADHRVIYAADLYYFNIFNYHKNITRAYDNTYQLSCIPTFRLADGRSKGHKLFFNIIYLFPYSYYLLIHF